MTLSIGDKLPDATLMALGEDGPTAVTLSDKTKGRKLVIFGLPGAFTGTCSTAHVPSYIRTAPAFAEKGVDEIICVAANDPFVMGAWSETTGAAAAGLTFLGDPTSEFIKAIGLDFSAPPVGLIDRSKRFSMVVEDGVVTALHVEENPGLCEVSAGENLLSAI